MSIYGAPLPAISQDTGKLILALHRASVDCPDNDCNPTASDLTLSGSYRLRISRIGDNCSAAEFYSQKLDKNKVTFEFGDLIPQLKPGRYNAELFQGTDFLSEFELQLTEAVDFVINASTTVRSV
jgi:hypothetical protein